MRQIGESDAALHQQANTARVDRYPQLNAQVNAYYSRPNSRYQPPIDEWRATWDAGVMLSWTPTDIIGADAKARTAEAHAGEIAAQRGALKNSLRLEINKAINALTEAAFALESSGKGLEAAEENYRVRRELYRVGRATIVEVTDAETELTRARLAVVNALVDIRVARVTLDHALGRDVARESR